ncbi:MAG: DUF86 domain-containing protein [Armatimonadota bacterium]|nr:DUF86 domain-containing protein [Armatimonadota bacterium]
MRDDSARLFDILEAIEKVERYTGIEREVFERDELIQTWMVYNLQIIGEAVSRLSDEFCGSHPDIPWRAISSMRNVIAHAYFRVDLDEVWAVIKRDLPGLKLKIQAILKV